MREPIGRVLAGAVAVLTFTVVGQRISVEGSPVYGTQTWNHPGPFYG
jgi:hypothetical protein